MVMYMRVRIGIVQDIIEDESIIGNVLDKIEITIQIKDISRETEKNKGIAPIYATNYYKWRFLLLTYM